MDKDTKFKIADLSRRLTDLKDKTLNLLENADDKSIAAQLRQELAEADSRKKVQIAFVGQYNSGKSTIISALTGKRDIKIDTNVATDTVSAYEWNDIVLLDTPGILAGKLERHDEATKDALRNSDLILYVLTSQLFDDVIFENFIDLAYRQHLADKMMIVINKMGQEAGEFEELVANYKESVGQTFTERGYDVEDFPIAFIDAADYMDGIDEEDEEYVQISNFEQFVSMLNGFVAERGLIKKQFDTPVRLLQSAVKNLEISQVDPELATFYRQFEKRLGHSLAEISRDFSSALNNFESQALGEVISASASIGQVGKDEWTAISARLDQNLRALINSTSAEIDNLINENYSRLLEDMAEFSRKDAIVRYQLHLDKKISSPDISIEEKTNLKTQRKILDWLTKGGKAVGDLAPGVKGMFDGISSASGSQLHDIVLKVGHFFGKKFKPWEAVGTASKIAKGAKFGIPVIGAMIDIGMQMYEDRQEEKIRKQISEERSRFITSYQTSINQVSNEFKAYFAGIRDNYNAKRDELNQSKEELALQTDRNKRLMADIEQLNGEYVDFIELID